MKTCNVTGFVLAPDGRSLKNAYLQVELCRLDRDGNSLVAPYSVRIPLGGNGALHAHLWPNVRGYAGTYYTATLWSVTKSYPSFRFTVPDEPNAIIADLIDLAPPSSIDDAKQQVILARDARDEARAYRDAAGEHAEKTGADASATADDRRQTGEDRAAVYSVGSSVSEAQRVIGEVGDAVAADAQTVADGRAIVVRLAQEVAEDREAVASDRQAVADDKRQTGLDADQTADDRQAVANNARQTGEDREATNADARATAEDRLQTGRDAQATADDRRQTGEDRSAVADDKRLTTENREATAADALATKADAEATAADRRKTGEDRTATGQDREAVAASLSDVKRLSAWTLYNKNVLTVFDACVRDLPNNTSLIGTNTDSGHKLVGVRSKDGTIGPVLIVRNSNILTGSSPTNALKGDALVNKSPKILFGEAPFSTKLPRRIKCQYRFIGASNWNRCILISYIDDDNWLGVVWTWIAASLYSCIGGVLTLISSTAFNPTRGVITGSITEEVEVTVRDAHQNFSALGYAVDVTMFRDRVIRAPLTATHQIFKDSPGRAGLFSGTDTQLYGISVEHST